MKSVLSENWVGSLIGLIGILIAIVSWLSSRARSRLASQVNSLQLLGSNPALPNEIEFLFKGSVVPKVTLSRVAIWNMGNTTLRRDQIIATDPVRITTTEGSIVLEARILKRTRQVNDFSVGLRHGFANEVECQFDYLDPRDGAVVEVIHTGNEQINVVGTLRGIPKPIVVVGVKREQPKETSTMSPTAARMLSIFALLLGCGIAAATVLRSDTLTTIDVIFSLFMGSASAFLGVVILFSLPRIPPVELSTQITSLETKKPFRRWIR
jgi:hypothetical protein